MPVRLVFALLIGAWLGSIVSLTWIVTPTAHGAFEPHQARRLLRPLFPRHYGFGIGCGFLAIALVIVTRNGVPFDQMLRLLLPTAAALACTIVARQFVLPPLRELPSDDPRFAWLHQISAMLNMTTLGALVLAMAAAVMR